MKKEARPLAPIGKGDLAAMVRRFEHGSRVPGWDEAADLDRDPAVVPDLAHVDVPDDLPGIEALVAFTSVLLCSECAMDDAATQAWLVDHLTGPDAPKPGCKVA